MTIESEVIKEYIAKSIAIAEHSSNKIFEEVKDKFVIGYTTSSFGNMLEVLELSEEQIGILTSQISWIDDRMLEE